MIAEEIALENEQKRLANLKQNQTDNNRSVHLDASDGNENIRDRSTNTREQIAKMSGVGAGNREAVIYGGMSPIILVVERMIQKKTVRQLIPM